MQPEHSDPPALPKIDPELEVFHRQRLERERRRIEPDLPFYFERISVALCGALTFAHHEGHVFAAVTCGEYMGEAEKWIGHIYCCTEAHARAVALKRAVSSYCNRALGNAHRAALDAAEAKGYAEGLKNGRAVIRGRKKKAAAGEPIRCLTCAVPLLVSNTIAAELYPAGTNCAACAAIEPRPPAAPGKRCQCGHTTAYHRGNDWSGCQMQSCECAGFTHARRAP
jgi:hypothetical protein